MPKVCPNCSTHYPDAVAVCPTDGATLRAADPGSDFIGTIVADRYVITHVLGEGGMGKVYRARHVRLPREAAIKVLHPRMVQDPAAVSRFDREAANASRIDHENVVRVFDFGETSDGLVYLAMEYVPGRTLKDVLEKEGPLTLARAANFVQQVADGLDAAHRLGIVHRDLKPDNILVLRDETGAERCKIADFGIAKAIGSGEKSLTQTGFVIGTPEYMSPEQLLGEEIDQRSDVYALALVAYQCVTGETPFDSKTPDRGMMARLTNQPRPLAELRPELKWPKDLQQVLNKGLDRERAKRYGSAGELAAAITEALKSPVADVAPPVAPSAPTPTKAKTPVAAPVVKRQTPATAYRQTPRAQRAQGTPAVPVVARPATPQRVARVRRISLWPRLPIVRWTVTAAAVGFGWLLLTEGSLPRALRRAGAIARRAESSILRMAGGSRGARTSVPAASTTPDSGGAPPGEAATNTDVTLPDLGAPPTVKAPSVVVPKSVPQATIPPAAVPPSGTVKRDTLDDRDER